MMRTRHENDTKRDNFIPTAANAADSRPGVTTKLEWSPNHRGLTPAAREFLTRLVEHRISTSDSVVQFLEQRRETLNQYPEADSLGNALVEAGLLTPYQLDRILSGSMHGLILGNHRVLDRLGAGAMGVVFLAEHMLLKRQVAVKVLPMDDDCPPALWERFCSEMRVLATLHHPNVVMAFDAGQVQMTGAERPTLLYLAMELVQGGDLEQYVQDHGPVEIAQACEWIRQAACGLQEAHDHHLIHRDIKPSNLLLSAQKHIKVTDFGLVRQFSSRLTSHHNLLGTLDYMAPEQSSDPSLVDGRADIYGLGATLFWLLTGELPYPPARSLREALRFLQSGKPRRVKHLRHGTPEELDALLDRMLSLDPAQRPALPLNIMNELLPFTTKQRSGERLVLGASQHDPARPGATPTAGGEGSVLGNTASKRVLVVDDEAPIRLLARTTLESCGLVCSEAADAAAALAILKKERSDLVLLDLNLPDMDGYALCRLLRESPHQPYLKIIVVSGRGDQNQLSEVLPLGADDYIAKPFGVRQLRARVEHALRLKEAQEQAEALARHLVLTNNQLESSLAARASALRQAEDALLFAMAKMAESRDGETSGHLRRLQRYCRCLAERVAEEPSWEGVINSAFVEQLERCVPLHDIGKIGLPESVLLKPGPLTDTERSLMETHTIIGDNILEALGQQYGTSLVFLRMASAIVRHHHERYDGTGYPDKLSGEGIPAAARLVAVADVYDALRRRRSHKPALGHAEAARTLLERSAGQFDPAVLKVFEARQQEFERIYRDIPT